MEYEVKVIDEKFEEETNVDEEYKIENRVKDKSVNINSNGNYVIDPDNGYDGISELNLGIEVQPVLQAKSLTITENQDISVVPDSEYEGLSKVDVSVNVGYNSQSKNVNITENGETTITPDSGYEGLSSVVVNTNVVGETYAPTYLTFRSYTGNQLNYETTHVDTKNLTSIKSIFENCTELTSLDLSSWNVSNVIDMTNAFRTCSKLEQINLSNWDTSSVTNMNSMFNYMTSSRRIYMQELDLSSFDTSKVEDLSYMFYNASGILKINLSSFNLESATNMQNMFYGASGIVYNDEVKNQILAMCTTATQITNKTLSYIGFTSSSVRETFQSLSNYDAFVQAGWSTN